MAGAQTADVVGDPLANKMARAIWAMLTRGEDYRVPASMDALLIRGMPKI
jgi:hypothetical protein